MSYSIYKDKLINKYVIFLNKQLNNEKKSRQIEKSIYNNIIKYTKKNNIKRKWNNIHFKSLYI